MARTSVTTIARRSRTAPTAPRSTRTHAVPTHLAGALGDKHLLFTVTCTQCLQQYHAIGNSDGVYGPEEQLELHDCRAGQ